MIETLIRLGLSEKEAKVYLAALELGSAPAAKIAGRAQINRPTTYVILEKLAQLGLVTSYDKSKIQYFTPEDPEQLRRLIEQEQLELKDRQRELQDHLPELKALAAKTDRPRVLVYDSSEAAGDYFYTNLREGERIYGFTDLDVLAASGEDKEETDLRLKKKISTQVIYTRNQGPVDNATDPQELREAKFIAREKFPFNSVITTAPEAGVIFMANSRSKTTVVIENSELAQSLKAIFDLLWLSN